MLRRYSVPAPPAPVAARTATATDMALFSAIAVAGVFMAVVQEYRIDLFAPKMAVSEFYRPMDLFSNFNNSANPIANHNYVVLESAAAAMALPFMSDMSHILPPVSLAVPTTLTSFIPEMLKKETEESIRSTANSTEIRESQPPPSNAQLMIASDERKFRDVTHVKVETPKTLLWSVSQQRNNMVHQVGSAIRERKNMGTEELAVQSQKKTFEQQQQQHTRGQENQSLQVNESKTLSLVSNAAIRVDTQWKQWLHKAWRLTKKFVAPWRKWENIRKERR